MPQPRKSVPNLSIIAISSHIADMVLMRFGQGPAIREKKARFVWHVFFFSLLLFLLWHFLVRVFVAPGFDANHRFLGLLRLVESFIYSYLLLVLAVLAYRHYRLLLLPRKVLAFSNIVFFFAMGTFLFARLYYSLYGVNPELFTCATSVVNPTAEVGINGLRDLNAFAEFLLFSGCTMLNSSSSRIVSNSLLVSALSFIQLIAGYFLIILMVATFVQIRTNSTNDDTGSKKKDRAK